jgi:hypothetical protein
VFGGGVGLSDVWIEADTTAPVVNQCFFDAAPAAKCRIGTVIELRTGNLCVEGPILPHGTLKIPNYLLFQ